MLISDLLIKKLTSQIEANMQSDSMRYFSQAFLYNLDFTLTADTGIGITNSKDMISGGLKRRH